MLCQLAEIEYTLLALKADYLLLLRDKLSANGFPSANVTDGRDGSHETSPL